MFNNSAFTVFRLAKGCSYKIVKFTSSQRRNVANGRTQESAVPTAKATQQASQQAPITLRRSSDTTCHNPAKTLRNCATLRIAIIVQW